MDAIIEKHELKTKTLLSDYQNLPTLNSNYDPEIPRKLMEGILGLSTNTIIKLENMGIITPKKVMHGGIEMVTYGIEDIHKVLSHRKITYKKKKTAEVISVFSQKGGVGKSAFTQHLASMLSLVGKVLVVDLDSQADATVLFGLNSDYGDLLSEDAELDPTIAELMDWTLKDNTGEYPYENLELKDVIKTISPALDIIPSDLDLGEINYSLNRLPLKNRVINGKSEPAELYIIKEVFDKVKDRYDFIVVDCPPNIETCNVSALFASNRILIPLELEAKTLTTMRRNASFLQRLTELHPGFNWDKILAVPNKNRKETIKLKALAALQDIYEDSNFISLSSIVMPSSVLIDKCSELKAPVFSLSSRYGANTKNDKHTVQQAKEFTNYFWALIHELLDVELTNLVFELNELQGN
jgi:cellulose biosynthesis protein BcsQ